MATIAANAIITAVRDVLDSAAGSLRTITAATFDGSAFAGLSDEEKSRLGTVRPNFDVRIAGIAPHGSAPPRNNSLGLYAVRVEVVVYRHVGPVHKVTASTRDTAYAAAIEDGDAIAQALEWPGNLTQTSAAVATGLVGAKLMYDGSEVSRVDLRDDSPGLIETIHRFHGIAQVAQAVS